MNNDELAFKNITELAEEIRTGALSPVEITEYFLNRIDRLDPKLHAFSALDHEHALRQAKAVETEIHRKQYKGPLHGVPYAVKELFDVKGQNTTAGTNLLLDNTAQTDCTVVGKLKDQGMILLGRNHMVPFACDIIGISHEQGTPKNPWSEAHRVPGGSSSGSAVAVAAGLTPVSLGSDTGGSIRAPAALCGIVGLKTTVGRVSRNGVYPLSWTYDSIGPFAHRVKDVSLIYQAIQGQDRYDEATLKAPPLADPLELEQGVQKYKIAFAETVFFDDIDSEVENSVRATEDVFRSLGTEVTNIQIPEVKQAYHDPNRNLIKAVEAYAFNRKLFEAHRHVLDPVTDWIFQGKDVAASDYFSMLRRNENLKQKTYDTLKDIDALLVPTVMSPAQLIDVIEVNSETRAVYQKQYVRNTTLGNYFDFCGISVCCGFTSNRLPIGLMIYAKPFEEHKILRIAHAYEQATQWHLHQPDLSWV